MSTIEADRLPRTVSACHVEIMKLRAELQGGDTETTRELRKEVERLNSEVESLQSANSELQDEVETLEGKIEARSEPVEAINSFLDEVERPVGQFKFDVIHGARTDRAILAMFDAAGRNP